MHFLALRSSKDVRDALVCLIMLSMLLHCGPQAVRQPLNGQYPLNKIALNLPAAVKGRRVSI